MGEQAKRSEEVDSELHRLDYLDRPLADLALGETVEV